MAKGFYKIDSDGFLLVAQDSISTPVATFKVEDYTIADTTVVDGWKYFPTEGEAIASLMLIADTYLDPTTKDVAKERERRLQGGFNYNFGDVRGNHRIGTTAEDMVGWKEVESLTGAMINLGDTTTLVTISTDTGFTQITSVDWQKIMIAAAGFRQPIWSASFGISALTPIPNDFTNDSYWPVSS